jgi:lysosomal acid phosphatase
MLVYLYIIILILFFGEIKTDDKLIFVMTHFRHGSRAPSKLYDKKNYLDYAKEFWKDSEELTAIGQRMHFLLGIRNRQRYIEEKKFLSEKYDPHELLIYSTYKNRTIDSATAQLQGLYPPYLNLGQTLTSEQEKMAVPPCNINYDNIDANIKQSLENNALPNSMTIIPLRTLTINDRKIRIYHLGICENKTKEFQKNNEKLESLINIQNTFKEKYVEKLNKFYGKEETYNLKFIYNFCDAFLCDYTEKREMNDLKNSGIDFEDMKSYCDDLVKLYYRDYQLGDKKREAAKLDVSPIMEEFIHYMKQRIDADINGEDISKKYEDYSRPKMLLVSGHDSTISSLELVLIEAFNKDLEFYEYPEFAAQLAFEVTTDDNNNSRKTYNDYYFNYYLNDNLKMRITVQEFLDKITPHVWNQSYIDKYCEVKNTEDIFITINEEKTIVNNLFFLFAIMIFLGF